MNWLPTLLALFAFLFLGSRLYAIWRRRAPDTLAFGLLTASAGVTTLGLALLDAFDRIIHSSEFGVLMVQGRTGKITLVVLTLAVSVSVAAVIALARVQGQRRRRLPGLLMTSVFVTLLSLPGIVSVESDNVPSAVAVFAYDLWWPPLVLWVVVGTLAATTMYAGGAVVLSNQKWRWLLITISGSVVSIIATQQAHFIYPALKPELFGMSEQTFWIGVGATFTTVALALAAWALPEFAESADRVSRFIGRLAVRAWQSLRYFIVSGLRGNAPRELEPGPAPRISEPVTPLPEDGRKSAPRISVALTSATFLTREGDTRDTFALLVALAYLVFLFAKRGAIRDDPLWYLAGGIAVPVVLGGLELGMWFVTDGAKSFRKTRIQQKLGGLSFIVAVVAAADLGWFALMPPEVSLSILTIAGAALATLLAAPAPGDPRRPSIVMGAQIATTAVPGLWKLTKDYAGKSWDFLKAALAVNSLPTLLAKTIVALVLLVALSELPDRGKTVIRPFQAHTFEKTNADLGDAVSDRVFYRLRKLYDEVTTETIVPETMPRGAAGTGDPVELVRTGSADAAVGKDQNLEVGGVKLPLTVLARPIQSVMRALLGTRSVTGVVHADSDWMKVAIAVERGHAWSDSAPTRRAVYDSATKKRKTVAIDYSSPAIDAVAEQLAFNIVSDAENGLMPGMTKSWAAFQTFREGLAAWRVYVSARSSQPSTYDLLDTAILKFREAVTDDPAFAIGYYRLGVALAANGEPSAAIQAYRRSLTANAYLATAANALAFAVSPTDSAESRAIWRRILLADRVDPSPVDQAAALLGFCQNYSNMRVTLLAYFYCKRAAHVFHKLPAALAEHARALDVESNVEYQLGLVFEGFGADTTHKLSGWSCDPKFTAVPEIHARFADAAARYFAAAARLGNEDAACRSALIAYARKGDDSDNGPMFALLRNADARRSVGQYHAAVGEQFAAQQAFAKADNRYRAALYEFSRAQALRPVDFSTLNNSAYSVWRWRHLVPPPYGPTAAQLDRAETNARTAAAIVAHPEGDRGLTARSTLAEVMLATGRPHEAYIMFSQMMSLMPAHWFSNETRQDLARAAVCSIAEDERDGRKEPADKAHHDLLLARATALLDTLRRGRKEYRERDNNVDDAELTLEGIAERCRWRPTIEHPRFVLRAQTAAAGPAPQGCRWTGVQAVVEPKPASAPIVRVWGEGETFRRSADSIVWVSAHTQTSHAMYLAQLEDPGGTPLSDIVSVDTHTGCASTITKLVFAPTGASTAKLDVVQAGKAVRPRK